ncbi:MAG TPA: hypothetical protein VEA40_13025 [Ramlibacter sp.]|nr:hypothetical protein [Ramlibacter sp.]
MGHRLPISTYALLQRADQPRLCLGMGSYTLRELRAGQPPRVDDLVVHHLVGEADLSSVAHLRAQIDLSHHAGNPHFQGLEKKETNWASRSRSSSTASSSARSARSRWDTA